MRSRVWGVVWVQGRCALIGGGLGVGDHRPEEGEQRMGEQQEQGLLPGLA